MNTLKLKQLTASKGLNILENSIKLNESGVDFQVAYATDQEINGFYVCPGELSQ